jgi:KDO2-lipid IV(A) lauroyltransferase
MKTRQRLIRQSIVWGLAVLTLFARLLPWNVGVAIGGWVGGLAFAALPSARRRTLAHLALAFGVDATTDERRAIAARSFANLGRSAIELLMLSRRPRTAVERLVTIEGEDRLKTAFAGGRGVIFLTGHFGNWELMAAAVTRRGYHASVVATPVYDQRVDELLVGARAAHGVHTISRGSPAAARHILSCLRRNAILGMLIDQDTDVDGVFVPFFGRPAHTPSGAATLALKTGAAVIFGFMVREGRSRHRLVLQGPVELVRTGNHQRDVEENTAAFTREIERYIRAHPDHWVWMHDRWKRQPPPAGPPTWSSHREVTSSELSAVPMSPRAG